MPRPEWTHSLRALKVVTSAVSNAGVGTSMQRTLCADGGGRTVTLPGFNLFSADAHARVVDWKLPKPLVGMDEIIGVYEEYADRLLGRVHAPERVVRQVLQPRHYLGVLGPTRQARDWWVPGATLVALAYRLEPGCIEQGDGWVALNVGTYRMEVRYDSVWSNLHGRYVTTTATAEDADISQLSVEPLTTSHPLALAAVDHKLPQSALWAVNNLLRVDPKFEIVSFASERISAAGLKKRREKAPPPSRWASWDALKAVDELTEAIGNGEPYSYKELYKISVPLIMPARAFIGVVGSPWRVPNQQPSQKVLQRFKEYLESI